MGLSEMKILRRCPKCEQLIVERDWITASSVDEDDACADGSMERWHKCPQCEWKELIVASPCVFKDGEWLSGRSDLLVEEWLSWTDEGRYVANFVMPVINIFRNSPVLFSPKSVIDPKAVMQALRVAFGEDAVSSVLFVPVAGVVGRDNILSAANSVCDRISRDKCAGLGLRLGKHIAGGLDLGMHINRILYDTYHPSLLRNEVEGVLVGRMAHDDVSVRVSRQILNPFQRTKEEYKDCDKCDKLATICGEQACSLFYSFVAATLGRKNNAERLLPLIQLAPQCIPIGVAMESAGVWLVMCRADD